MKTIYGLTIAALAAAIALTSCTREEGVAEGNRISGADGLRVITLSYGASTKATFDGLQPKFEAGDVIKVAAADGSVPAENCTVTVEGGVATITTHILDVALKAAFPSTAAVMNGQQITGVNVPATVPATQTGKPEDAMSGFAAEAAISAGATEAAFEIQSQSALLRITPPSGTTTLTVKSLKPVVGGVARTGTAVAINTEGADDDAKCVITVSGTVPATCYVALAPGVKLCDLSFDAASATAGKGSAKGIPESKAGATGAVAAVTAYTIDGNDWHEYVEVGGKKWATMNIGATTMTGATGCGDYYMWGATEIAYTSLLSETFTFGSKPASYVNSTWDATRGFAWVNCNHTDGEYTWDTGNVFTKYTTDSWNAKSGVPDGKTELDLADDAAYANWGGTWRMPDIEAFRSLYTATYWGRDITQLAQGYYVFLPADAPGKSAGSCGDLTGLDKTKAKLFFPAAGRGEDNERSGANVEGTYWSLTLESTDYAESIFMDDFGVYCNGSVIERRCGLTIRAILDD